MSNPQDKFFLTTPIYYVNARPHIGHAYTTIVGDVLARRARAQGIDTYFLTGTDEHGQKIERSAAAAGIPPQQFANQVSKSFSDLWQRMGITHDKFIRTTDEAHKRGVQKLFRTLQANGAIYKDTYTGQYCVSDEAFVDVAPGAPCPDCGRTTETISETNYYFKLSEYQQRLLDLIESNALLIEPNSRRNEVLSFLRGGLKDLSISRTSFKWGIPVPGDEEHVIYVWLDALANYMTALGYGSEDESLWEKYWRDNDNILHIVGKEIIRFHCVYWPAFLMAAGLPLPKQVVAHGWLLFEESKMSKSKGNIVRTEKILDAFCTYCPEPQDLDRLSFHRAKDKIAFLALSDEEKRKAHQDRFAADILRYFLLREIPFGQDGSFSSYALITNYNADLANGYGNLVSRTLNLVQNSFPNGFTTVSSARFSSVTVADGLNSVLTDQWFVGERNSDYLGDTDDSSLEEDVDRRFGDKNFQLGIREIFSFIRQIDGYISINEPWKLAKSVDPQDKAKLESTLYIAAESIRWITALLYPILPYATASVWAQLGLGDIEQAAKTGQLTNLQWGGLEPGKPIGTLSHTFPVIKKDDIPRMIQLMTDLETPAPTPAPTQSEEKSVPSVSSVPSLPPEPEATPTIGIEDFIKIDLRVAQIVVCERIPKADKLLRLEVDLGTEKRQILSGIAEWYTPEELIGRRIVVIANLAPRKMRGLESHGMLLAASTEGGKPYLCTFADAESLPLGSRIK